MRLLVIDELAKASVKRVVDFATLPENWYRPGRGAGVPGDDPRFVVHLQHGFRCVFTITKAADGLVLRHLSISVNGENYPNIAAALMIAQEFGFTGWNGSTIDRLPAGWMCYQNRVEHCIALGQPYTPPAEEATA